MTDLQELKRLAQSASAGPWKWWTSNSTLRLTGADGKDGDVICALNSGSGYPHLRVNKENQAFIAAANPQTVLEIIERLELAESKLSTAEAALRKMGTWPREF